VLSKKAYSKINLHLEVCRQRDDGYHDIFSLMSRTNLADLLQLVDFSFCRGVTHNITIIPDGGAYNEVLKTVPVADNLIARAVEEYFKGTGKIVTVTVSIEKNIPLGGGLAGGSADAAAILQLLQKKLHLHSEEKLHSIASSLGADVPFCLGMHHALCEGIGDVIDPLEGSLPYTVLIVNNGIHVNTKDAYAYIDERMNFVKENDDDSLFKKKQAFRSAFKHGSVHAIKHILVNDFEAPIFLKHPELALLKAKIIELGAVFSCMTGSGSTIVGLFDSFEQADYAKHVVADEVEYVALTSFV
jgi:4-diphosphocytidyl-2-C-methyl-D-erythritol kinase